MGGYQEDNKLRFSFRNHFVALFSLLFLLILIIAILTWLNFDKPAVVIFAIFFVIDLIPTLYLHIEYYLKNKDEEYEVQFDELIRYKNGESESYKVSDIEIIKVYLSPALYRGSNLHFLGIEAYHYARVYLKSGEELIITCLLTPNVEKALRGLRGVKIERKRQFFNNLHTFS